MGRRGPHALILLFVGACVPPREPARHLGGETHYLGAYVAARTSACDDRTFELAMAPRPRAVIETMPAIYESWWELRACGQALRFSLDCSLRGETWSCSAHEWPMPTIDHDYRLAHEIEAAARRAPACPPERSCVGKQCAEDGMIVRRLPQERGTDVARFEVARCGLVAAVNVRCTDEAPFQCVTSASPPVDTTRP